MRHIRSLRTELMQQMATKRAVQKSEMDGYIILLHKLGHEAELIQMTGVEMKTVREKRGKFIF